MEPWTLLRVAAASTRARLARNDFEVLFLLHRSQEFSSRCRSPSRCRARCPCVATPTTPTIVQYATPSPSTYVKSIAPEIPNGCRIINSARHYRWRCCTGRAASSITLTGHRPGVPRLAIHARQIAYKEDAVLSAALWPHDRPERGVWITEPVLVRREQPEWAEQLIHHAELGVVQPAPDHRRNDGRHQAPDHRAPPAAAHRAGDQAELRLQAGQSGPGPCSRTARHTDQAQGRLSGSGGRSDGVRANQQHLQTGLARLPDGRGSG
jgi:hypothetical protein